LHVEKLAQELVSWIKGEVSSAGANGVVFGMSGGVDSSVISVLCGRALSGSCLGIIMPCNSDNIDRKHAELVAAKFNLPVKVVALDGISGNLIKLLSNDSYNVSTKRLSEANIKPRLRMLTLYYFSNRLNYIVVGTGNRCEIFVGYFTKYGDGGVDILPLGNLVKGQVQELADYLGIPREIIDKPPTAGLWIGQTDEEEMGLTYQELDHYLLTGEAEDRIKNKIALLVERSNHKRCLPPVPPLHKA
jgi:NAD+ synthase